MRPRCRCPLRSLSWISNIDRPEVVRSPCAVGVEGVSTSFHAQRASRSEGAQVNDLNYRLDICSFGSTGQWFNLKPTSLAAMLVNHLTVAIL
jgi:hypothetical protein